MAQMSSRDAKRKSALVNKNGDMILAA